MILLLVVLVTAGTLPASLQAQCQDVDLDTHSLHACVVGDGAPTIVLAAGAGQTSATWSQLVPQLEHLGSVLTFDRAGLGRSEPGPLPRSPERIAAELVELLNAMGAPGPYMLVGHSMGGHHVLAAAQLLGDEVMGVIMLDAPPPDFEERRMAILSPAEQDERRRLLEEGAQRSPPTVRAERAGAQQSPLSAETAPISAPLVIVVADSQDFGTLGDNREHRRLWVESSREWLTASEHSSFVVSEGSSHMVHHDDPAIVVQLITEILSRRPLGE